MTSECYVDCGYSYEEDDCRSMCKCTGGEMQSKCEIFHHIGVASVLNAIGMIGFGAVTLCILCSLNKLLHLEGYKGQDPVPDTSLSSGLAVLGQPVGQPVAVMAVVAGVGCGDGAEANEPK